MSYIDELEQIRTAKGGVLKPQDVVEFARNPKTFLHSRFTWDDGEAARKYRLWEARELIQVAVTVSDVSGATVRAYVSLSADRGNGGGYRAIDDVLSDDAMRASLLRQARGDMTRFRNKYHDLEELAGVFDAMRAVTEPVAAAC